MIYFMYAIASIILFNLLVMVFIVWKFGIEEFFDKDEEVTKDNLQNALSDDSRLVKRLSGTYVP